MAQTVRIVADRERGFYAFALVTDPEQIVLSMVRIRSLH